jgi:hypothetical protein
MGGQAIGGDSLSDLEERLAGRAGAAGSTGAASTEAAKSTGAGSVFRLLVGRQRGVERGFGLRVIGHDLTVKGPDLGGDGGDGGRVVGLDGGSERGVRGVQAGHQRLIIGLRFGEDSGRLRLLGGCQGEPGGEMLDLALDHSRGIGRSALR